MIESKRSMFRLAGWSVLAAAAALAGCSKKEDTASTAAAINASDFTCFFVGERNRVNQNIQ